jgi:hypothetical protein
MTAALQLTENSSQYLSDDIRLLLVPPGAAGEYLRERIEFHLKDVLEMSNGKLNIERVMEMQLTGECQVWVGVENGHVFTAAVTQMEQYEAGKKVLKAILGGGDPGCIKKAVFDAGGMKLLEKFAREEGCESLMIEGRRGWGRMLPDDFKEVWTTFEKEL